jgi:hypothetical protein
VMPVKGLDNNRLAGFRRPSGGPRLRRRNSANVINNSCEGCSGPVPVPRSSRTLSGRPTASGRSSCSPPETAWGRSPTAVPRMCPSP